MANKTILLGRLTKEPELRKTNSDISVLSFTLAVDRKYKVDGEKVTDFHNCVAWKKPAEIIAQYVSKGDRLYVEGELQSRSYDNKDGNKVYVTEVNVDTFDFIEQKSDRQPSQGKSPSDFESQPKKPNDTISEDDLPF